MAGRLDRFFWSLKHDSTKFEYSVNIDDGQTSVFKYVATSYNPTLPHQTLNYLSLDQFERVRKMPFVA
jgi:hypothetical protein